MIEKQQPGNNEALGKQVDNLYDTFAFQIGGINMSQTVSEA